LSGAVGGGGAILLEPCVRDIYAIWGLRCKCFERLS
jgi:hypothetical protein